MENFIPLASSSPKKLIAFCKFAKYSKTQKSIRHRLSFKIAFPFIESIRVLEHSISNYEIANYEIPNFPIENDESINDSLSITL